MSKMIFKDRVACFKTKDQLLKAGTLFEDFEFLQDETADIRWLRPGDISSKPIMTDLPIVLDVQAADKGSRAFLGALATISHRKDMIQKIFPDDQNFDKLYCGIFFFHFWRFGDWEIVGIDDRLAYSLSKRELVNLKSMRTDVYFFSLLEKAYAKFKGGYDTLGKLKGGDILVDLTGGVSQIWTLSTKDRDQWFPMMRKLVDGKLPATANIQKTIEEGSNFDTLTTYTLKNVAELDFEEENRKVRLVRLGDPFGTLGRYTGAWNDDSPEWKKVPQHIREKLVPKDGGGTKLLQEFWMTFSDFFNTFATIHFCILSTNRWDLLMEESNGL
uniref:Calpain catalytic domain-containing protein n=1 Tax=Lygus hesperus TaxID=30085 RepID=A0A0K8SXI6_LYGHE